LAAGGVDGLADWAGGGLKCQCPKHHRLKHHSQWTPHPATENNPPGWTSPTGRHYKPEHQDAEPTHWPPESGPGWPQSPMPMERSLLEEALLESLAV
jgi:hypothetical protein